MGKRISVHDHFFRSSMADIRVAKEFFQEHLPENIKKQIDWDYLEPQKETFINESDLSHQACDLLYKTCFNGEEGYVYTIVEHQSKPLKEMPFRILRYIIAVFEYHIKHYGGTKLPPVYPLIFYTGNRPYNYSTDIFSLFEEHEEFMRDILLSPYKLVDVTKIEDEELKKKVWSGLFMYTMKYIYEKDFLPRMEYIMPLLQTVEKRDGIDYICTTFNYILDRGEIRDKKVFEEIIRKGLPAEVGEKVMTLANLYRNEGRAEGRAEGEARGEAKALQRVVINLLNNGMSVDQISQITPEFSSSEITKIKEELDKTRH